MVIDGPEQAFANQSLAASLGHGVWLATMADKHKQRAFGADPDQLGAQPVASGIQIDPVARAQIAQRLFGHCLGGGAICEQGVCFLRRGWRFSGVRVFADAGFCQGFSQRFCGRLKERGRLKRLQFALLRWNRLLKSGCVHGVAAEPGLRGRFGPSLLGCGRQFFSCKRHQTRFLRILLAFTATQLEDRPMQLHEAFKKRLALARVLPEQRQSGVQSGKKAGNHLDQLARLLQRDLLLDAPEQVGHHRAKAERVDLVSGVDEPGVRHGQRPGAKQKVKHQAGHLVQVRAPAQFLGNRVGLGLALFGKAQGDQYLLALGCFQLVFLLPDGFEPGQGRCEGLGVLDAQAVELVEGQCHRLKKSQKLRAEFVVVFKTAPGHALHEAPARMAFVGQEVRIDHGQAQQRRLQRHNSFAQGGQQARILRHLVDQLAHQLQSQHLAHALGIFFELRANQGARFASRKRAPDRLAQLAAFVHCALRPVDGR